MVFLVAAALVLGLAGIWSWDRAQGQEPDNPCERQECVSVIPVGPGTFPRGPFGGEIYYGQCADVGVRMPVPSDYKAYMVVKVTDLTSPVTGANPYVFSTYVQVRGHQLIETALSPGVPGSLTPNADVEGNMVPGSSRYCAPETLPETP